MDEKPKPHDLTRTVLSVLFIAGLIAGSLWVLRPFLGALLWATTVVIATWPFLTWVQARLWNRRGLAVVVMTLALLLVLVVPLSIASVTIAAHAGDAIGWVQSLATLEVPPAPAWASGLPVVGDRLADAWNEVARTGGRQIASDAAPYLAGVGRWLAVQAGGWGKALVQFLLMVVIAAILYANGEVAAATMIRFGQRLAGTRGVEVVRLAGGAVRGVALGVVVTALAQSLLGGVGLVIAGVPFASVLAPLMLMLCVAQLGPLIVLLPAVGWLYWSGSSGWATFLLVWSIFVGTMDNFLRPMLIRRGANLPLLLIFSGVIGGLISFGLIGIFVGPIVLAVAYTLLKSWIDEPGTGASSGGATAETPAMAPVPVSPAMAPVPVSPATAPAAPFPVPPASS